MILGAAPGSIDGEAQAGGALVSQGGAPGGPLVPPAALALPALPPNMLRRKAAPSAFPLLIHNLTAWPEANKQGSKMFLFFLLLIVRAGAKQSTGLQELNNQPRCRTITNGC